MSTPTLKVPFIAPAFKFIGVNVSIELNEVSNYGVIDIVWGDAINGLKVRYKLFV